LETVPGISVVAGCLVVYVVKLPAWVVTFALPSFELFSTVAPPESYIGPV
jgi:hypothetical protein